MSAALRLVADDDLSLNVTEQEILAQLAFGMSLHPGELAGLARRPLGSIDRAMTSLLNKGCITATTPALNRQDALYGITSIGSATWKQAVSDQLGDRAHRRPSPPPLRE